MVDLAALAVALHLVVAGVRVAREPDVATLCHLGRHRDDGSLFVYGHAATPATYWGKYWRRVLGLPWPGGFVCPGCAERQGREFGRPVEHLEMANGMEVLHERMAELGRSKGRR
jgi:hypothetical protein